jgi:hypothetical protein
VKCEMACPSITSTSHPTFLFSLSFMEVFELISTYSPWVAVLSWGGQLVPTVRKTHSTWSLCDLGETISFLKAWISSSMRCCWWGHAHTAATSRASRSENSPVSVSQSPQTSKSRYCSPKDKQSLETWREMSKIIVQAHGVRLCVSYSPIQGPFSKTIPKWQTWAKLADFSKILLKH